VRAAPAAAAAARRVRAAAAAPAPAAAAAAPAAAAAAPAAAAAAAVRRAEIAQGIGPRVNTMLSITTDDGAAATAATAAAQIVVDAAANRKLKMPTYEEIVQLATNLRAASQYISHTVGAAARPLVANSDNQRLIVQTGLYYSLYAMATYLATCAESIDVPGVRELLTHPVVQMSTINATAYLSGPIVNIFKTALGGVQKYLRDGTGAARSAIRTLGERGAMAGRRCTVAVAVGRSVIGGLGGGGDASLIRALKLIDTNKLTFSGSRDPLAIVLGDGHVQFRSDGDSGAAMAAAGPSVWKRFVTYWKETTSGTTGTTGTVVINDTEHTAADLGVAAAIVSAASPRGLEPGQVARLEGDLESVSQETQESQESQSGTSASQIMVSEWDDAEEEMIQVVHDLPVQDG
jgi:hypothetical protein